MITRLFGGGEPVRARLPPSKAGDGGSPSSSRPGPAPAGGFSILCFALKLSEGERDTAFAKIEGG